MAGCVLGDTLAQYFSALAGDDAGKFKGMRFDMALAPDTSEFVPADYFAPSTGKKTPYEALDEVSLHKPDPAITWKSNAFTELWRAARKEWE